MFFTRRKVGDEVCLRLYGDGGGLHVPWGHFDARMTWAEHIERVVGQCKEGTKCDALSDREGLGVPH